mmetsp:Transcript_72847/g.193589  ORF Transcript_72847/g.193589 Transcript_72847/m.193589 type:complete len:206 (+) Transcript_72847:244-861(+)
MYFFSLRMGSTAPVTTFTSGYAAASASIPSLTQTTLTKIIFFGSTPFSTSTLMHMMALPPVASIGSSTSTAGRVAMSGGSFAYMSAGSAVSSSRWMSTLPTAIDGIVLRTTPSMQSAARRMDIAQSCDSSGSATPLYGPHGVITSTSVAGRWPSASSSSICVRRSEEVTNCWRLAPWSRILVWSARVSGVSRSTTTLSMVQWRRR